MQYDTGVGVGGSVSFISERSHGTRKIFKSFPAIKSCEVLPHFQFKNFKRLTKTKKNSTREADVTFSWLFP